MKLYVWVDVLDDFYSSLVCVHAETEERAWELLAETHPAACSRLKGEPNCSGRTRRREDPSCIDGEGAFATTAEG